MIIFINGSINSGKSTVSKKLALKLGNTALVEIDELRNFIEWMSLEDSIPLNLENACLLIRNFAKHSLHVVVPYPLSQKDYTFITTSLSDLKNDLHFFTLSPKLEIALKNRGGRELDEWEINRIKYHYETGINTPKFGKIIDNSNQSIEETVDTILEMVQK